MVERSSATDFTPLADMIVKAEADVRMDVIRQDVGSSFNVPYPDPLDADKADDNAQLAPTCLQGSLPPGQPAAASEGPATVGQNFRPPALTEMITTGTDQAAPSDTKEIWDLIQLQWG